MSAARQQAQAVELTLLKADNKAGYFGVRHRPGKTKPCQARVTRGGKEVSLGQFATAEEAALCVARSPEGQAAAKRTAAAPPLTSEEVRQQAQAEKLTLRVAGNTTGYFGVSHQPDQPRPYKTQVRRGGKMVYLGRFATAEEAALCLARQAARSLRRKELLGRWEQALTALAARTAEEEAEAAAEKEAEVEVEEEAEGEAEDCASPGQASQKPEEAPPAWPEGAVLKQIGRAHA